jgi:hypothetical protein
MKIIYYLYISLTRNFIFVYIWGCSSVGRALEWHSRGLRFDPAQLHIVSLSKNPA